MIYFDIDGILKKLDMTNAELSKESGIREGTLLKYKNGGYKTISTDILNRLIKYCVEHGIEPDMDNFVRYIPDDLVKYENGKAIILENRQ